MIIKELDLGCDDPINQFFCSEQRSAIQRVVHAITNTGGFIAGGFARHAALKSLGMSSVDLCSYLSSGDIDFYFPTIAAYETAVYNVLTVFRDSKNLTGTFKKNRKVYTGLYDEELFVFSVLSSDTGVAEEKLLEYNYHSSTLFLSNRKIQLVKLNTGSVPDVLKSFDFFNSMVAYDNGKYFCSDKWERIEREHVLDVNEMHKWSTISRAIKYFFSRHLRAFSSESVDIVRRFVLDNLVDQHAFTNINKIMHVSQLFSIFSNEDLLLMGAAFPRSYVYKNTFDEIARRCNSY